MRLAHKIALGVLAVFTAMQFVRPSRTNPSVTADVSAPVDVKVALRRACYDCHSNETSWPWYSHVAPASWLVAYDVSAGRRELNFSAWGQLDPERQSKLRTETAEAVIERSMPPWFYAAFHPSARLSGADRRVLQEWGGPTERDREEAER